MTRFAVGYRAFYGIDYIFYSIHTIYNHVEKIIIAISSTPQAFEMFKKYKPEITEDAIRRYPDPGKKIEVIKGAWGPTLFSRDTKKCEANHANIILDYIRDKDLKLNYLIILDTDEILTYDGVIELKKAIEELPEVCAFKMKYKTYWKGLHHIAEEKNTSATICVKIAPGIRFMSIREINKEPVITLKDDIYYHHASYALNSKKLLIKMRTFGHAKEIRKNWYKDVWKAWDKNKNIENLHPLLDGSWWKKTIRIKDDEVPYILRSHPYFKYETVDDFEKAMRGKEKPIELWIPHG